MPEHDRSGSVSGRVVFGGAIIGLCTEVAGYSSRGRPDDVVFCSTGLGKRRARDSACGELHCASPDGGRSAEDRLHADRDQRRGGVAGRLAGVRARER